MPKKLAVLEDSSSYDQFAAAFDQFLLALSASPDNVRGFIALSSSPGEIMPRYKLIRKRMRQDEKLSRRLETTHPGTRYRGSWEETEFWLLAKDAPSPYTRSTADYDCPTLEVLGDTAVNESVTNITYSVRYPIANWLDTPYTFRWTVTNGKIITGQGTPSITVKRNRKEKNPVTVTIDVGGGDDEDQYCLHNASTTTEIGIVIKPKEYF
ncbi:MAG: hypothetical protein WBB81_04970 [Pyrinomonadaceae bacterium]|nr:hypothetical protein [Chloracidobacterium sp.]